MFVRQKTNKTGSKSVQIISKSRGKYRVIKTIGSSTDNYQVEKMTEIAKQEIEAIRNQPKLIISEEDEKINQFFTELRNSNIRTVGPELIFGKIYDSIGFAQIKEELFRHLVIARLAYPLSKLKTVDYLYRYQGIMVDIDEIYRFMDKLSNRLKTQIEQIVFAHTQRILEGNISVVFYDMTTLYFEASQEDDLRRIGFSKDGKHSCPQIFLGLLVGLGGYAIGYDIFEGNIYEGKTLIPFIEKISKKFNLSKPVIVADSGLLSKKNIKSLKEKGYEYIIGARLKNESESCKQEIISRAGEPEGIFCIDKGGGERLIVAHSSARASRDEFNRRRGLNRLEKQIKAGKLTKGNINNKGYNKYLKMTGEITLSIDYEKYEKDKLWDGLKGYMSNTKLDDKSVIDNYNNLWHIEKAFRMSKTDLRIRPIYHRLRHRIEAHICISFAAYSIYKELERLLSVNKLKLSIKKAAELTHNMYEITFMLPESRQIKSILLKMDEEQLELYNIIRNVF